MSDSGFDYTGYSDKEAPTISGFDELDSLVTAQRAAQREVERIENELREAKAKLVDVSERQLPDLMDQMGLEKFETRDGFKIQVKKTLRCSIAGDRKWAAIKWLRENGHGDIVKQTVAVPFQIGKENEAHDLAVELRGRYGNASEDQKVEPPTLRSLLNELMEQGVDVPLETFGAYEQRVAKIST